MWQIQIRGISRLSENDVLNPLAYRAILSDWFPSINRILALHIFIDIRTSGQNFFQSFFSCFPRRQKKYVFISRFEDSDQPR